jgi:hypothetical protein
MKYDENELMVEYSEMTSFNFNSKEYQEVKKDFIECKDIANGLDWFVKNFTTKFKKAESV